MAQVEPLKTLRYEPRVVGSFDAVTAPPYDVIDEAQRAALAQKSPFNVVEIDLPRANGGDPYLHAQTTREAWQQQGVVVRQREPAIRALTQAYTGPDRRSRTPPGSPCRGRPGPGRRRAGPPRLPLPGARGGLRAGPHPPARADPPGAEGGSSASNEGHAGQPLPHLQPLPGPGSERLEGARAAHRGRPVR